MADIQSAPKLAIVPIDKDNGEELPYVMTGYSPESLSFSKKAKFNYANKSVGGSVPPLEYHGGEPIELDLELFFDCYEESEGKQDVRVEVKKVLNLANSHKCGDNDPKDDRPPKVKIVWKDTDPLGIGDYTCVIESVSVDYIMFLSDGTPCRAKVKLHTKQADDVAFTPDKEEVDRTISTAGLTPAQIEVLGGQKVLTKAKSDAKIEDPSTWPDKITIEI